MIRITMPDTGILRECLPLRNKTILRILLINSKSSRPVAAAENNTRVGLVRSMASAGARAYNGGLGAEPLAGVQGAEPPVGVQGGKAP